MRYSIFILYISTCFSGHAMSKVFVENRVPCITAPGEGIVIIYPDIWTPVGLSRLLGLVSHSSHRIHREELMFLHSLDLYSNLEMSVQIGERTTSLQLGTSGFVRFSDLESHILGWQHFPGRLIWQAFLILFVYYFKNLHCFPGPFWPPDLLKPSVICPDLWEIGLKNSPLEVELCINIMNIT